MAGATVLYQDRETPVDGARVEDDSIWLTLPELTEVSGWELKPECVCKDEICVPVPDLSGRLHTLSELRGKKLFLLFWASW